MDRIPFYQSAADHFRPIFCNELWRLGFRSRFENIILLYIRDPEPSRRIPKKCFARILGGQGGPQKRQELSSGWCGIYIGESPVLRRAERQQAVHLLPEQTPGFPLTQY